MKSKKFPKKSLEINKSSPRSPDSYRSSILQFDKTKTLRNSKKVRRGSQIIEFKNVQRTLLHKYFQQQLMATHLRPIEDLLSMETIDSNSFCKVGQVMYGTKNRST
jgi:hypothetical protein